MTTINFIGCGKLGKTIARLLAKNNAAEILGIINTSMDSSKAAVAFVGQGAAYATLNELPVADVYFITTRDDAIESVCLDLIATQKLKKDSILIHCSGSLSSQVLNPAKLAGCHIASVHPVKSFANPEACIESFEGAYCAYEGDVEALATITQLFKAIGGNIIPINSDRKKQYHAAMVMANNYLVTLHYHATMNLAAAGVDDATAKILISNTMTDAFNNLKILEHSKALTGPIQRGDSATIKGHMDALESSPSRQIYSALGIGTLPLTSHSDGKLEELKKSLSGIASMPTL